MGFLGVFSLKNGGQGAMPAKKDQIKIQTTIAQRMDDKLRAYGDYLGLSKNNYIRYLLIQGIAQDEKHNIPEDVKSQFKPVEDKNQLNMFATT